MTSTLSERFWSRVDKSGECWMWTGLRNAAGYGRIGLKKKNLLAHRLSWQMAFGDIPDGMLVLHECDNPSCVNPGHLKLGTYADNTSDMMNRGRCPNLGSGCHLAKLTENDVREIRARIENGESQRPIARDYGIHQGTVSKIARGQTWSSK